VDNHTLFQSTPSGGKATRVGANVPQSVRVSIHAFRGEGDRCTFPRMQPYCVSIHAFRGEGDEQRERNAPVARRFNPRLPGGRRP